MKRPRRQFLHLVAGAVALPAVSRIAIAQTYPTRPITMIVPFAAGGPTDTVARILIELRMTLGHVTRLISSSLGTEQLRPGGHGTLLVGGRLRAQLDSRGAM
jgi:hypothetical protein